SPETSGRWRPRTRPGPSLRSRSSPTAWRPRSARWRPRSAVSTRSSSPPASARTRPLSELPSAGGSASWESNSMRMPTRQQGRTVLVDPEEVLWVIAPLQLLQTSVLLGAVRLTDAILALVAEEVHIDARLVRLERRPEVPHPLPLLVEAVGGLGAGADVVREA